MTAARLKQLFLIGFCGVLVAPALQWASGLAPVPELKENRRRAERPTDYASLFTGASAHSKDGEKDGGTFATKFESYFNDHYGFRDFLIRAKHQIDYALFGKSDEVLIGKDGFLFYKSVVLEQQLHVERTPEEGHRKLYSRIERLRDLLSKRGITLVFAPMPLKNSIYPEKLPDFAPRRRDPDGFRRYQDFLKGLPGIVYVDTREMLLEMRKSFDVFHRTDFHWNDPAGAEVGKALVNRLARESGRAEPWTEPVETYIEPRSAGGQSNAMALLWPVTEEMRMIRTRDPEALGKIRSEPTKPNDWVYSANSPEDGKLLPPTLLYGDSFADAFQRAGFTRYFSRLEKRYVLELKKRLADIPPGTKFLVIEHIETALFPLLLDAGWEEALKGLE